MLARSASRPVDTLVAAAQRIEGGNYSQPVDLLGTQEFSTLASTLNSMQTRIAEREQHIRFQASHDELTGLPNRNLFREHLLATLARAAGGTARTVDGGSARPGPDQCLLRSRVRRGSDPRDRQPCDAAAWARAIAWRAAKPHNSW